MPDQQNNQNKPLPDVEEFLKEFPKINLKEELKKEELPPPPPFSQTPPAPPTPSPISPKPPLVAPPPPPLPKKEVSQILPPAEKKAEEKFKSFIRTMDQDLEAIRRGQKPESLPIQIQAEAQKEIKEELKPIEKEETEIGKLKKPLEIKLGPVEKAKPLELPSLPKKTEGIQPPKITIPETKKPILSPKFLIIILLGAIIGLGSWYFLTKEKPVVKATPSPTITQEITPTPFLEFQEIFEKKVKISLPFTGEKIKFLDKYLDPPIYFKKSIEKLYSEGGNLFGEFNFGTFVELKIEDENNNKYPLNQIFERLRISLPDEVLENLDKENWAFFIYGQREIFDEKGGLKIEERSSPSSKLGFIAQVNNLVNLRSALNLWEIKMPEDLKDLFSLNPRKTTSETFLDNIYKGVEIRYKNFQFADNTIDYAIIHLDKFNNDYLLLTNSRESIYNLIDLLLNK